jgi:uncharacterized protein (DUF1697 family)
LSTYVALLRGINVTGRNKIPMPELCGLCMHLGWADVQSYIQSGNLIFEAEDRPENLETELETAIKGHFDLSIPVLVRTAEDWPAYLANNPFPDASRSEPNLVMLALSKRPPNHDAVERLKARAHNYERVAQVSDALWIHFAAGVAKSKLSPALFDRLVGSPVTMRNWRTVLKLDELLNNRLK